MGGQEGEIGLRRREATDAAGESESVMWWAVMSGPGCQLHRAHRTPCSRPISWMQNETTGEVILHGALPRVWVGALQQMRLGFACSQPPMLDMQSAPLAMLYCPPPPARCQCLCPHAWTERDNVPRPQTREAAERTHLPECNDRSTAGRPSGGGRRQRGSVCGGGCDQHRLPAEPGCF